MNSGGRRPTLTSIQAAPFSSWLRASSSRPATSFSSKSFFVEGTESLIDSPMIVNPGMAMAAIPPVGRKISPADGLVNLAEP